MIQGILLLILILVGLGGTLLIASFMIRRALSRVISIFRLQGALDEGHAKTPDELGLKPPDLFHRFLKPRDYKQHAIQVLVQKGIVRAAEGGKLYLVEDRFDERLRYPKRGREADPQPTR